MPGQGLFFRGLQTGFAIYPETPEGARKAGPVQMVITRGNGSACVCACLGSTDQLLSAPALRGLSTVAPQALGWAAAAEPGGAGPGSIFFPKAPGCSDSWLGCPCAQGPRVSFSIPHSIPTLPDLGVAQVDLRLVLEQVSR